MLGESHKSQRGQWGVDMIKIHCLYVQNFYRINKNLFNYIDSRKEEGREDQEFQKEKKRVVETSTDFKKDVDTVQSIGLSSEIKPRRTQQTVHSREKANSSGDLTTSEGNGLFQVTRKCTGRLSIKSREDGDKCLFNTHWQCKHQLHPQLGVFLYFSL